MDLPQMLLRAEIVPASINVDARTFSVVFSTGAPVTRYDWAAGERYIEKLSLKPSAVRLDRLNNGAPVLNSHSTYELSDVIGVVEPGTARVQDGKGLATLRFSRRDDVEPIWQDVRDGIIRNVSVGYRVYTYEQTTGETGKLPTRLATDWEPFEISAVPIGADPGAQVRAERTPTNPCVIITRKDTQMDEQIQAATEVAETVTRNAGDPGAPVVERTAPAQPVVVTDVQRGIAEERKRSEAIMRSVMAVGLPPQLAQDLITRGVAIEDAQAVVIEEVSKRGHASAGPGSGPSGVRVDVTRDANAHVRSGITNALLNRVAPQFFKLDEVGKLYRGRSVLSLAEYYLQSYGYRTTDLTRMEIAGAALGFQVRAGMHTTSDFANILADVANKTLLQAYAEAPQTFASIVTRKELPDFKPVRRVRLSEAPALQEVGEHGEIEFGSMSDGKEQYQLATYAARFGISRQALINDDTEAFSDLAVQFGRMARQKESDLVWAQITSNPTMGDGVVLFHTDHGNVAGSGAAISVESIGAGRAAMGKQKGLAGVEYLNISPLYLIVPKGKETIADQFVSTQLTASAASNVNPFSGKLTVVSEPRLDADSATAWYLAASPSQVQIVELGMLAGMNGPVVESRSGWEVDGLEVKCRHDVAAKVIDFRGLYKNGGA